MPTTTPAYSASRHLIGKALGYLVLGLTLAFLFFFLVLPVFMIVVKAFQGPEGFTLEYFQLLFANELQTTAIKNSLLIGLATTVCCTILCIPLALVQTKFNFPLKTLLSGLLLTPMVMPPFVGAIGIQRFFARHGSVNIFLMERGWIDAPIDWLGSGNMFWAVVILETLHLYPILYLNLTAAMANIDPSLEEMAATLGTTRWQRFRDVIWPLARPGYFAGAIIVFIWALTDLGTPLLTGYHETLPVRIFNMVTDVHDNPVGYAMVFLVILLTVAIFAASKYFLAGKKYEMLGRGHVGDHSKNLGWIAGFPCYFFLFVVSVVALLPHISVIITSLSDKWFMTALPEGYTLEHFQQIFKTELPLIGIKNSLMLASLSTLFDLVFGLLVAYVVVRKLIPGSQILDSLVMLPLALPGIVLAFGYVVTYTNTPLDPMNNPVPLLIIAYGIRRLPYMVRSAAAGLQQTSASLEEASSTFGASRFHTMRKITIPLVMANLIAGSLLCFAYAMLDVSDSLILAMKDQYYPLTKAIYSLFLEHGKGELIASALGVVSMAILGGCIMAASVLLGKKMGELFRSG